MLCAPYAGHAHVNLHYMMYDTHTSSDVILLCKNCELKFWSTRSLLVSEASPLWGGGWKT